MVHDSQRREYLASFGTPPSPFSSLGATPSCFPPVLQSSSDGGICSPPQSGRALTEVPFPCTDDFLFLFSVTQERPRSATEKDRPDSGKMRPWAGSASRRLAPGLMPNQHGNHQQRKAIGHGAPPAEEEDPRVSGLELDGKPVGEAGTGLCWIISDLPLPPNCHFLTLRGLPWGLLPQRSTSMLGGGLLATNWKPVHPNAGLLVEIGRRLLKLQYPNLLAGASEEYGIPEKSPRNLQILEIHGSQA